MLMDIRICTHVYSLFHNWHSSTEQHMSHSPYSECGTLSPRQVEL